MIKIVFKWATLLALCNATQSFFSVKPMIVNAIMKSHYNTNLLTLRGMSNGGNGGNSSVPMLKPKPIPVMSFDDLFLNWNRVNRIFLSGDCDRIILLYGNDKKGVYYIDPGQLSKIEYMISLTTATVTIEPVCNLDNPWFHLYCSPRASGEKVVSSAIVKTGGFNISNVTIDNNDDNYGDNVNDDYGFDFGFGM